ncbi:hypothetical protein ACFV4N_12350 [Actinosynnema sp. NPDC059797]
MRRRPRPPPARGCRSFARTDYLNPLTAAHHQLDGPTVLVWDNLPTHRSEQTPSFIDSAD